jgi:long-subunit acyl-CoA synthetase (AMP-forming)
MAANYLKGEPLELRWRSSWCEHQARTIPSLFQSQAETLGDSTLYLVKREGVYQPVSWQTVRRDVETLAAALIARGVQPGDRVAILSENRYEWVVADLAILHAGAVSVTLHFPLTPEQVEEQLRDSESCAIFVSTAQQAQKVEAVRDRLPALKHYFSFDAVSGWTPIAQLQQEGEQLLRDKPTLVRETAELNHWDSLATLIYTSGTTGDSKGVMLSHGNLLSSMYASMQMFPAAWARLCDAQLFAFESHLRTHLRLPCCVRIGRADGVCRELRHAGAESAGGAPTCDKRRAALLRKSA